MTAVRVCLGVAALGVLMLIIVSAWPWRGLEGIAVIVSVVLITALIALVGAIARRLFAHTTGVDITWPLLFLGLLVFGIFWSGMLTGPGPDGCYTDEQASAAKALAFELWVAWSSLAILGLGAAISKDDWFSPLATFILLLTMLVSPGVLYGLALGDLLRCPAQA